MYLLIYKCDVLSTLTVNIKHFILNFNNYKRLVHNFGVQNEYVNDQLTILLFISFLRIFYPVRLSIYLDNIQCFHATLLHPIFSIRHTGCHPDK